MGFLGNMGKFNKATAGVIATAVTSVLAQFIDIPPEYMTAAQTLIVGFLVWAVPNIGYNS